MVKYYIKQQNEQTIVTCNNLDRSHKYNIEQMKPNIERIHTTLFCFHKVQKQVKLICSDKGHDGGYLPESRRP